jgi:hypothetical protein
MSMEIAKSAQAKMLLEYGKYVNTSEIIEKDGDMVIRANLNTNLDFFPDIISGVSIEITYAHN